MKYLGVFSVYFLNVQLDRLFQIQDTPHVKEAALLAQISLTSPANPPTLHRNQRTKHLPFL